MAKLMTAPRSYEVEFKPNGKSIAVEAGTHIADAARQAGIDIVSTCGGNGKCGQCHVIVAEGEVSPPARTERTLFSKAELSEGHRLACCTKILGKLTLHLPDKTLNSKVRLQVGGRDPGEPVAPMVQLYEVDMSLSDLSNSCSDFELVTTAMETRHQCKDLKADHRVAARLSEVSRQQNGQVSVYLRDGEIVGVAPPQARPVGLAIDLGTTKVAAYLLDLVTGQTLSAAGALNPQVRYGDDIMSRMQYVCSNPGSKALSSLIRSMLNDLVLKLTAQAGVSPQQVADVCIVANTAMIHLLLDLPVRQLASAPYVAATRAPFDIKARELALEISPGAYIHILPSIGGFVGGDHVAMILATGIDSIDKVALGLDIGTNTEIVLRRPDASQLFSVSCPSGPAFEGAHVVNGLRAATGAIESVQITAEGVCCRTIENSPAIGLCGSGIVDTVAELYRCRLINERGRFQIRDQSLKQGGTAQRFLLVPESKSGTGKEIYFSQKDVNQIQLAKGAIRAGIDILMDISGTRPDHIEEIFIAGAFGSYLNLANAVSIGLIPDFPAARWRQVGNAAAVGAKQALLCRRAREQACQIADRTRHIDLTRHPKFSRHFALGMLFPTQRTHVNNI